MPNIKQMQMRSLLTLIFLGFSCFTVGQEHRIFKLQQEIRSGKKDALVEIGEYFDNDSILVEIFKKDTFETKVSQIARRIVKENTFFLDSEIQISELTSRKEYVEFITRNLKHVSFLKHADVFILTQLSKRSVEYEIFRVPQFKLLDLADQHVMLFNQNSFRWLSEYGIDSLINKGDPLALYNIASLLVKDRTRFQEVQRNKDDYIKLLQLLTRSYVAVKNKSNVLEYNIGWDREDVVSSFNLLTYFSKNYTLYEWNNHLKYFQAPSLNVSDLDKNRLLFETISTNDESLAFSAFVQLCESDPDSLNALSDEFINGFRSVGQNRVLPNNSYRMIKHIAGLTSYYRQNEIEYKNELIIEHVLQLASNPFPFIEKRSFENKILRLLTLDNVATFEYYGLLYSNSPVVCYSVSRILDIFYSRNWEALISSEKHLKAYLYKAYYFKKLDIDGVLDNYLVKFTHRSESAKYLRELESYEDDIIAEQIAEARLYTRQQVVYKIRKYKSWGGNRFDLNVPNLTDSIEKYTNNCVDIRKCESDFSRVLHQIHFNQIDTAIVGAKKFSLNRNEFSKYFIFSFLSNDWGFFLLEGKLNDDLINQFSNAYHQYSEYGLYEHFLDSAKIDYKTMNGELDYDKIYTILKYNIVAKFGSANGPRAFDNEVYAVIKLLELTYNTTLGFPSKRCNGAGCNSADRAIAWRNYLWENKLLTLEHNEPVSFKY